MRVILIGDKLGLPVLISYFTAVDCEIVSLMGSCETQVAIKNSDLYVAPFIVHSGNTENLVAEYVSAWKELRPELAICFSYDLWIPTKLLEVPEFGVFNLHGGKLPQYRGANVLNWAIINGETSASMTLHKMSSIIDEGPICKSSKVEISESDTAVDLREKLVNEVPALLDHLILGIRDRNLHLIEQDLPDSVAWRRRTPDDGFFDLSWPTVRIHNLIRALVDPWPGAFWIDELGDKHVISSYKSMEEIEKLKISSNPII